MARAQQAREQAAETPGASSCTGKGVDFLLGKPEAGKGCDPTNVLKSQLLGGLMKTVYRKRPGSPGTQAAQMSPGLLVLHRVPWPGTGSGTSGE